MILLLLFASYNLSWLFLWVNFLFVILSWILLTLGRRWRTGGTGWRWAATWRLWPFSIFLSWTASLFFYRIFIFECLNFIFLQLFRLFNHIFVMLFIFKLDDFIVDSFLDFSWYSWHSDSSLIHALLSKKLQCKLSDCQICVYEFIILKRWF